MLVTKNNKVPTKEAKVFLQYNTIKLDPVHFPAPVFDQKQSKPKVDPETGELGEQIIYYSAPLIYKKEDSKGRLVPEEYFDVEGPVMVSKGGIVVKKDGNRYRASMWCSHSLKDPALLAYCGVPPDPAEFKEMPEESTDEVPGKDSVGFLSQLHLRSMLYAFDVRKKIAVDAKKLDGFEALFNSPLRWATNDDGSLVENRDPSIYYNLMLVGDPTKKGHRKAPFTMPCPITEANPKGELDIPWEYLQEAEVTFKPVLRFKSIYAGGKKCSIQMEIISAVVYNFEPIVVASEQVVTLAEARADEALVTRLAEQLRKAEELLGAAAGLKLTNSAKKKDEEDDEKGKGKPKALKYDESKAKSKGKAKAKEEEDDEEEESKTKKIKSKSKAKAVEEDEAEEPKTKASTAKKPSSAKAKQAVVASEPEDEAGELE